MSEVKICVKCKHCRNMAGGFSSPVYTCHAKSDTKVDLVTGATNNTPTFCNSERSDTGFCKPEGRLFEAKEEMDVLAEVEKLLKKRFPSSIVENIMIRVNAMTKNI